MSASEIAALEALLEAAGYCPSSAYALHADGMGPHELVCRLAHDAPTTLRERGILRLGEPLPPPSDVPREERDTEPPPSHVRRTSADRSLGCGRDYFEGPLGHLWVADNAEDSW